MKMLRKNISHSRRDWIKQAGALAGAASIPLLGGSVLTFAQSKLAGLPRIALVIGNTRYRDAPLKNPVNDAKAIAGELQQTGFRVNLQLDAGRTQMSGAIQSFTDELAKTKGVGLFYYAGHGAQLAWRNYLIPVDAAIEKLEDMRERTVELAALLQGLHKASNPMNVIILDACRDNPFGTRVPTEAKGLSQFDAPPGSLLAYATSPGNTAGDGDGANGLYTENLLRELKVPEAKIEDVFKRVRLAVRRRSEGQQIPWESTSLEDDFYFVPPKQAKKLSEEEAEKQFEEELANWEKIKDSKEPEPLEEYLRKYPSGKCSELAQFKLDRLLAAREKSRMEAERIARKAEDEKQARLADERRIAEEKRIAEERRLAEAKKLAEEKRLADERRLAAQKRLLEEQRISKLAEDKRRIEEARLAEEIKSAEMRRLGEEKKIADEMRLAEQKRQTEEKRLAEEKLQTDRARAAQIEHESQRSAIPTTAVPPATTDANPFSKGISRLDTNYQIGDRYNYRIVDTLTNLERTRYSRRVTGITESTVIYNDGRNIKDLLLNNIQNPNGNKISGMQVFVYEYQLGKKWTTQYDFETAAGRRFKCEIDFKVTGKEVITIPAGTFNAWKVEGRGTNNTGYRMRWAYWIAPERIRHYLVFVAEEFFRGGAFARTDREELVSFQQKS